MLLSYFLEMLYFFAFGVIGGDHEFTFNQFLGVYRLHFEFVRRVVFCRY